MQAQRHGCKMSMGRERRIKLKKVVSCCHIGVAVCTLSSSISTVIYIYNPDPHIVPLTLVLMLFGSVLYLILCISDYLLVSRTRDDENICICRKTSSYYSGD